MKGLMLFERLIKTLVLLPLFVSSVLYSQPRIFLDSTDYTLKISHENYQFLEDPDALLTFEEVRKKEFESIGKPLLFDNPSSAYWIKLEFENHLKNSSTWVLEGFNFRIDSTFVYVCDAERCYTDTLGAALDFGKRDFHHKNQSVALSFERGGVKTVYMRFQNYFPSGTALVIRNLNAFSAPSYAEYFLLGLFYGIIFLIAFYNFLLFFSTKENAFLYYFLYVLVSGLFFLSQDGIGFQYLWPDFPILNKYMNMVALCLMTILLLLYSSSFLNYKVYFPKLVPILNLYIVVRLIILVVMMIWFSGTHFLYLDFLPFLLVYITSFSAYRKGMRTSIFFITGFTILLFVFTVHGLRLSGVVASSAFIFYSTNVGVLMEMIVLGVGLAVKIAELKDHEQISMKLEQMVQERTDELDNYLYKTSHDINGPLKTIIGLADLGMLDKEYSEKYFQLIHQTSRKLDNVVHSIAEVLLLNKALLFHEEIKLGILTDELRAHVHLFNEKNILTTVVKGKDTFISDHQMIWLAMKNLIDFSLRRGVDHQKRSLHFSFEIDSDTVIIIYKDDSNLIPHIEANSAFDIFKKLDSDQTTGLELYSARTAIRKLNGSVALKSIEGKNVFEIYVPNGKKG